MLVPIMVVQSLVIRKIQHKEAKFDGHSSLMLEQILLIDGPFGVQILGHQQPFLSENFVLYGDKGGWKNGVFSS